MCIIFARSLKQDLQKLNRKFRESREGDRISSTGSDKGADGTRRFILLGLYCDLQLQYSCTIQRHLTEMPLETFVNYVTAIPFYWFVACFTRPDSSHKKGSLGNRTRSTVRQTCPREIIIFKQNYKGLKFILVCIKQIIF